MVATFQALGPGDRHTAMSPDANTVKSQGSSPLHNIMNCDVVAASLMCCLYKPYHNACSCFEHKKNICKSCLHYVLQPDLAHRYNDRRKPERESSSRGDTKNVSLNQYTTRHQKCPTSSPIRLRAASTPSRSSTSVDHREYPLVVLLDRPERLVKLLLPLRLVHLREHLLHAYTYRQHSALSNTNRSTLT